MRFIMQRRLKKKYLGSRTEERNLGLNKLEISPANSLAIRQTRV